MHTCCQPDHRAMLQGERNILEDVRRDDQARLLGPSTAETLLGGMFTRLQALVSLAPWQTDRPPPLPPLSLPI